MFKAKIVSEDKYYKAKSKIGWLGMVSAVLMAVLIDFENHTYWYYLIVGLLVLTSFYFQYRWGRDLQNEMHKGTIELDLNRIELKDQNKKLVKSFIPATVDYVEIRSRLYLPDYDVGFAGEELTGNYKKNRISIRDKGETYDCTFLIESHYMVNQLTKIIDHWNTQQVNFKIIQLD